VLGAVRNRLVGGKEEPAGGLVDPTKDEPNLLGKDATYMAAAALLRVNEGQLDGRSNGQLDGNAFLSRLFGPNPIGRRMKDDSGPRENEGLATFKRWVDATYGPGSFQDIRNDPALLGKALVDFASDPRVGGFGRRGGPDQVALGAQAKVREFLADGGIERQPLGLWSLDRAEHEETLREGFDGDAIKKNPYWSALLASQRQRQAALGGQRELGDF
jgi:hypothetical protein